MTVTVVGAGPAGMAAARTAAEAGADVLLIDSGTKLGGQYHRQNSLYTGEKFALPANVTHLPDTAVWAVEPGPRLHLRTGPADGPGRTGRTIDADALVLATGAYDRALPFPGWDLPGVYTAGAAQAMAKGQRVAVGRRVLLSGTGPFLFPVAESLLGVGAEVLGVLEANHPVTGWLANPGGLLAGAAKAAELGRYLAVLARHRVPYRPRTTVLAAHGEHRVEAVTTARVDRDWRVVPGTEQRVECDAACVGFGFLPQLELAVAAGCALRDGFVDVDFTQRTSVPGVFAAGELTGIGGAVLSEDEGTVAGAAAAGAPVPRRALRGVRAGRRFAAALEAAYPIRSGWRDRLTGDTLVCRCEEVTYRALCDAVEKRDATGVRALKLVSRAGLGQCQGRICGRTVAELTGTETTAFSKRPIAAPVRLGELAEIPKEDKK
ncbi:FAD/NAD(P)-dependent oxidoreductase [Amycolatopsis sp. CA-230715]|uniref:FAD/NAD(P)-dependent oxidoreductase n=1 Tax=Amycolatopsis sp. CA-230715 TaxID=2745196 RepID=UPI001C026A07|nr:FAD/NAD(P)-binding oxidoreductase [Amycolatopsis sp. CA-230715]QWF78822.1 Ferredoxin--NADP reductase [Amycolatopsis sp. CA-230715]